MSEIVKHEEQRNLDGFSGFSDEVEGSGEQSAGSRLIQGQQIKFSLDYKWITKDGDELPKDLELVAVNVLRVKQRWGKDRSQGPLEEQVLEPNQPFPDFNELNDAIPRSEWLVDLNGQPRGPWQGAFFVYFINMSSMDKYTFIANLTTIGACIAVRELADKVKWKRQFRGELVYPVVRLTDTFMNTRFGGRQRAHFDVKPNWITFGLASQLEAPTQPQLEQQPADSKHAGVKPVAPVTAKEAVDDQIRF